MDRLNLFFVISIRQLAERNLLHFPVLQKIPRIARDDKQRYSLGFTLIELIVVMALIGVLASVLIVLINPATQLAKANDGRRKADLSKIQFALEAYRADEAGYAPSLYQQDCPDSAALVGAGANGSTYLEKIPCDPVSDTNYIYTPDPPSCPSGWPLCTRYTLTACIQYLQDKDKDDPPIPDICPVGTTSFTVNNP